MNNVKSMNELAGILTNELRTYDIFKNCIIRTQSKEANNITTIIDDIDTSLKEETEFIFNEITRKKLRQYMTHEMSNTVHIIKSKNAFVIYSNLEKRIDPLYEVTIYVDDVIHDKKGNRIINLKGEIIHNKKAYSFNPYTVLCDLHDIFDSDKKYYYEYNFNDNYKNHIFCIDDEIKNEIKQYINEEIDNHIDETKRIEYNSFIISSKFLFDSFQNDYEYSISDFSFMRELNDISYTYEFQTYETDKYLSVYFPNDLSVQKTINEMIYDENCLYRFHYKCYTLEDTLFAIWHALIFHGYNKFVKCQHCGKYFVTNSFRNKYCSRKSPITKYSHLNCEQASRNASQYIRKRKKAIYEYMYTFKNDNVDDFLNAFADLKKNIITSGSNKYSVHFIETIEFFLNKDNIQKNWYDK